MIQSVEESSVNRSRNFSLVTALRGVAASWVVLFHLWTSSPAGVARMPRAIGIFLFEWGHLGVPVFFALSGFVITHSLRNRDVDAAEARSFMRRRFLRIAPPYYVAIVVVLLVGVAGAMRDGGPVLFNDSPFSVGRLFAHLTFTQQFFAVANFEEVFWTLCYEMGFYLVMILVMLVLSRMSWRGLLAAVMAVSGVASLVWTWAGHVTHWVYLADGWYMFAFGVVAYLAATQRCPSWWMWACVASTLTMGLQTWTGTPIVAGLTAAAPTSTVAATSAIAALGRLINARVLVFLGTISYSLYLFHPPIRTVVLHGWTSVFGEPTSLAASVGLYALQFTMSVGGAWIAWRLIERPSMRWASRRRPATT